jgi:alkylhydroperoxidase family enzyme
MLPPDPAPRMAPARPEEFTEDTRAFLAKWTGGFFNNADKNPVLLTFAHHPQLADVFSQLNIHLLTTSTLPVKQRQIAIMRLAWVCKAVFMWSSHLNTSVACGLDPEMFDPIKVGAADPYFTEFERSVIRATEELIDDRQISDASWQALMREWTNQQMLDFLFTVGAYMTVAYVMRSTGAQRPAELLELAERYGAPD